MQKLIDDRFGVALATEVTRIDIGDLNCSTAAANEFLDLLLSLNIPDSGLEYLYFSVAWGNKIGRLDEYVVEQLAKKCTAQTHTHIYKDDASEEL